MHICGLAFEPTAVSQGIGRSQFKTIMRYKAIALIEEITIFFFIKPIQPFQYQLLSFPDGINTGAVKKSIPE